MDSTNALLLDDDMWFSTRVVNESGLDLDERMILERVKNSPEVAALTDWALNTQGASGSRNRQGSMFERDRYVTPGGVFEQYKVALRAAEHDDVVAGVMESTEGLTFAKMTMEAEDRDQEDVWNQIAKELDLDSRLREMWREMFIYSQCVVAMYWGRKTFTVRGKSKKGVKRKQKYQVRVPLGMTMLDPFKVLPVGNFFFNREKLAYLADEDEVDVINAVVEGREDDPFIREIMVGPYALTDRDKKMLTDNGAIDRRSSDRLFLLNPQNVFRHTETRPQYQPWPNLRIKSVFELLDMKNQLRQMDRAHLIGGTNFIVLIKKGSDAQPATQREVNALSGYARTLARVPMLVGDHRLSVEIVTPSQDYTLMPEKYNALDARITARLYQMFMTGNYAAGAKGDDSIKLARVVARGLESRRHQLKRTLERQVWQPIVDQNPDTFEEIPDLRFTPKRIALDFDQNLASFMQYLADRGDISRDTLLSEFDFNQDEEARKRRREDEDGLDELFQTAVPFSSPAAQPFSPKKGGGSQSPGSIGRTKGGNRNGGGAGTPSLTRGKTKQQQSDEEFDE